MDALEAAWQQALQEVRAAAARSAADARAELVRNLNHIARRLREFRSSDQFFSALRDGAALFAPTLAVLSVEGGNLRVRHASMPLEMERAVPLGSGAALRAACESGETIVALRTPPEVTELLSAAEQQARAVIVPVRSETLPKAILFAPLHADVDVPGLELTGTMASSVLERATQAPAHVQIGRVQAAPESNRTLASLPDWASLEEGQRQLHVRAQRFARVKTAEWLLFWPALCEAGRRQQNLYLLLHAEIDAARDAYRKLFMTSRAMVDYLHLEMLQRLAGGEERALGADYPGPMEF